MSGCKGVGTALRFVKDCWPYYVIEAEDRVSLGKTVLELLTYLIEWKHGVGVVKENAPRSLVLSPSAAVSVNYALA